MKKTLDVQWHEGQYLFQEHSVLLKLGGKLIAEREQI